MFLDSTKYVLLERGKPEIQIFAEQGKILQRVDEVLNDLHIHRSSIEGSKYEYYNDGKKGLYTLCRLILKPGTVYSLGGKRYAIR